MSDNLILTLINNKLMMNDEQIYCEENKLYSLSSNKKRKNIRENILRDLIEENKQLLKKSIEIQNNTGAGVMET